MTDSTSETFPAPGGVPGVLAKVVVGIDGTEPSLRAVAQVAPIVQALGGEVVAVFVRHLPVLADSSAGEALVIVEETIDDLALEARHDAEQQLGPIGVKWSFVVREGDPAQEILAVAHEQKATLVVVGATIHGSIASLLVSSVAAQLVHHSDLPLLIIRPEGVEEGAAPA
jgi:nucleotide-binding universal stress UspA family protein